MVVYLVLNLLRFLCNPLKLLPNDALSLPHELLTRAILRHRLISVICTNLVFNQFLDPYHFQWNVHELQCLHCCGFQNIIYIRFHLAQV